MKNYELVAKLMELPAGADVNIWLCKANDEITYDETDEMNEIKSDINDVDFDKTNNKITLC